MADSESDSCAVRDTDTESCGTNEKSWQEEVATELFNAHRKFKRLEQLRARMVASKYFDEDDLRRVAHEIELLEQQVDVTRSRVTKADWACVKLFLTLKHREAELESAVAAGLIDVEADQELFGGLVKKQVYLTRLAEEQSEKE